LSALARPSKRCSPENACPSGWMSGKPLDDIGNRDTRGATLWGLANAGNVIGLTEQ
jgi:hypothetical protein